MHNKILWIRPDAIGDAILSSSMLSYIKNHYDNSQVTVLCQQHLAELYQSCPLVGHVIGFDKKRFVTDPVYRDELLAQLGAEQFDYALNSVYSREASMDCLATNIGAKQVVGFGLKRQGLFDFSVSRNHGYTQLVTSVGKKPELERHKDFLSGLVLRQAQDERISDLSPQVWTSSADETFAQEFFTQHQLEQKNTIAFFAGAQSAHRLYSQYGQALRKTFESQDVTIIVLGGKSDSQINAENCANLPFNVIDLSGQTTLTQTAALLKRCRLAFGAETGLAHIACAVKIPNVVLLGGGHFGRFMPYSPLTSAVILPLKCYGCDWRCKYKKAYCVQDVDPSVLAYALQHVMENGVSSRPRLFIQNSQNYKRGLCKPRWQMPEKLANFEVVWPV